MQEIQINDINLAEIPFMSLEGEGTNLGTPTLFIRTSKCNMRCIYCDSKHSYTDNIKYNMQDLCNLVLKTIEGTSIHRISITGGEPTLQEDAVLYLIELLKANTNRELSFNLETNGSKLATKLFREVDEISCDVKGPSSGENENPVVISYLVSEYLDKTIFKFVVSNEEDLDFIKKYSALPKKYVMKNSYSKFSNADLVSFILKNENLMYSPRIQTLLRIQ